MGLRVEETEKKGEKRNRLYSTVTDTYWHEGYLTREEAVAMLVEAEERDFQTKALEIDATFPNGYSCHGVRYFNAERSEKWFKFLRQAHDDLTTIPKAFEALMRKIRR